MTLVVGSLFSGIGGLDLGLEWAGMEIEWQVENDDWCTRVLERHWPRIARFRDVQECHGAAACSVADAGRKHGDWRQNLQGGNSHANGQGLADGAQTERPAKCSGCLAPVDLICGGFPCQPVSIAGKRTGESDSRWLWPEFYRIVCEVRPRWVLAENTLGLLSVDSGRLFGGILRDLAEAGYDAVWFVLSAADVGAPHLRERVFVVAHTNSSGRLGRAGIVWAGWRAESTNGDWWAVECHLDGTPHGPACGLDGVEGWECGIARIAKGQKNRVNRLRGIGNAVVPQVAETIGRWIMAIEAGQGAMAL